MRLIHLKKTAKLLFIIMTCSVIIISCAESKSGPGSATPVVTAVSAINSETMYLESNGRRLAYRKLGTGHVLVLSNRFRGIMDDWDPMFLDELAKDYTVITFDYSGIGLSTLPNPGDSLRELQDIHDLVSGLNIDTFSLIGWSHGGKVAQVYAATHPQQVSHLILLGTGPIGDQKYSPEKIFFDRALKPVNDFEDEVILFFEPAYTDSREAAKKYHDRVRERVSDTSHYVTPEKFQKYCYCCGIQCRYCGQAKFNEGEDANAGDLG
jgi:pimeloyl-ACP methyl ester carboxylesterase